MLGTGSASSSPSRAHRRTRLLVSTLALVGVGASVVACSSTPTYSSATIVSSSTTPRTIKPSPDEAWCKKMDSLPDSLGSFANFQQGDVDQLVVPFTELRDAAPTEAKADFELLLELVTKASAAAKAGTIGTAPDDMGKWMLATFGADGPAKFSQALAHIETVQTARC